MSMINISKKTFASSAIWKMMDSLVTKGASTIISIILARLLLPSDYGILALTAVFINFTGILVQSGINTALIRKADVDELDYTSALCYSLFIATLCYITIYFASPYIAHFYGNDLISPVLRVQMLSMFIGAFGNVRTAIITREFRFKELCIINVTSTVAGGTLGIVLAYMQFGVWALVFYTLLRDILSVLILFIWIKWKPVLKISFQRLRELASFSIWVLLSTILDFWGNNLSNIILGKKYSMGDLGVYSKGGQLPELFCLHTFGALTSVMLPTMAGTQNDKVRLKGICRKMVSVSAYVIFPMMSGLALIGKRLIPVLYTDKWNGCIPILWMACIYYGVNPLRSINMQLLYAIGKSKMAMMVEVIRFVVLNSGILFVVFILKLNVYAVSGVSAITAVCIVVVTQIIAKDEIGYLFIEWAKDLLPHVLISLLMSVAVYLVGLLEFCDIVVLFFQALVGIAAYWMLSVITKNKVYYELYMLLAQMIDQKRKK